MSQTHPALSGDRLWRLVLLALALIALWRVWLYLESAYFGPPIPVHDAAFTFMPLPDFLFAVLFLWMARRANWRENPLHRETAIIFSALHVTALLAYGVFFHQWTKGATFSFEEPTTYLYAVLPGVLATLFLCHVVLLARRARLHQKTVSSH